MSKSSFTLAASALILLFATPAFARVDMADRGTFSQELRQNVRIRIQGELICRNNGAVAANECNLAIRENGTGKIYQLAATEQAQKAMKLYTAGNTRVTVQGTLADNQTVEVSATEAL